MPTPKFRLTEMIKVGDRESLAISINEAILGKAYCIIALHILAYIKNYLLVFAYVWSCNGARSYF